MVFGQIGGYTALLWMIITFCLSGYEEHKFTNSLISSVYLSTRHGPETTPALSKTDSDEMLRATLASPANFKYGYFEAFTT